ncbi:type II CRISPR RNA-guided endonuclease Cas9 [Comamonas sp. NLF-1-9]|uniref:type II CRISPR RNA-guided endonuclease Cas9 n=1 Tax=Comamonas sp. NLF-1-9 TaxID=2853163 RepID=UPI001C470F88|nr:type II CRISPR RNA-guided endonuclease Cas9 [Comamonas sp. NLF-1-9]QXL84854.1 type II CRISPR RNA-guided endonuclease Cas9 [Comamonas sp. NLF-1-9]
MSKMRYRLALDLGSSSLGWAMVRLRGERPVAIIKAGVRIFSDGRNPKDGTSLAVTRRMARAMRRRRDRLLKRKNRMMASLLHHGFFPGDPFERKSLERLNPYELRAKGLDTQLTPAEFARALFHINQRRGFKSNRKTDKKDNDSGALKTAISALRQQLDVNGANGKARTVGELLWRRMRDGSGVRARYRERRIEKDDGKTRIDKSYDLYIDRAMIEAEFDALWARQAHFNAAQFNEAARSALKDCLLHQRPLKPVKPGRCTLLPDQERAPLALPSQQRFRIYQEVNHLRILGANLVDVPLSVTQRDIVVDALERNSKRSFKQIITLLKLPGDTQFNLEDVKRQELKGNATSALLGKKDFFGPAWFDFSAERQDVIAVRLLTEESEAALINWLQTEFGLDEAHAYTIANASLPEGYGNLSAQALARILPALETDVITYDKAVQMAGFEHHSHISHAATTGEILPQLPYYGEYLQRHVGFGSGDMNDPPEKRFGKIANPTVHIGLNQVRTVVNALIRRYGHPSEVIVEVSRELKQSHEQRKAEHQRQADNQRRNDRLRADAAAILHIAHERVRHADIQKLILWEELSRDVADRRCPYSGVQISAAMVLSDEVEIEHILPFSMTLDDSLNNKTVAMRRANRVKGNRTPFDARADFEQQGWHYEDILARAERMPRNKRYRFGEDGHQKWLREDQDFLARALNDTRHLSRVAREYLSLICPQDTRVIPGRMTAELRHQFGLNHILGPDGKKNRNDHRHHAVDACVIAVTDQGLLQRFAKASASAREQQLDRLIENMPLPWESYREHVARAIGNIWVSHKPDHGYEGAMMEETSYGIRRDGSVRQKVKSDGSTGREISNLIRIVEPRQSTRHGLDQDGKPLPYKGYVGGSNYCIEITRDKAGKWVGEVISTFRAYEIVRTSGLRKLRHPTLGQNGQPLMMRLGIDDVVRMEHDGREQTVRLATVAGSGQIWFAPINEANVDARNRDKSDSFAYISKRAGSLKTSKARRVTISPIGELRDPGFKG